MLFLVGLAIAVYPFASNWLYQEHANDLLDDYAQAVEQGSAEDYERAFERARTYNEELVGQTVPDVFAIREGTTDVEYESQLNILGNLMMGYVDIPVISVHLPIYHYSDEESLTKGCGHIFGSSLPVGGESSHAVITAHRGLPTAEMFSELDQVREGDKFFLRILNQTLAYEVDRIEVVEPSDTRSLAIERGSDYVTLVTCTPYGVNTDRLLVRGHRVDYVPGDENAADGGFRLQALLWTLAKVGAVVAGVGVAALVMWLFNRRSSKRGRTGKAAAGDGAGVGGEAGAGSFGDADASGDAARGSGDRHE